MDAAQFVMPIERPIVMPIDMPGDGQEAPVPTEPPTTSRAVRGFVAAWPEPRWWTARGLVAQQYRRHFRADLSPSFPRFIGLLGSNQQPAAAVGVRFFDEAVPFCQRYLDQPLEQVLGQRIGATPDGDRIVELGNLAVAGPRLLAPMFEYCAHWLLGQQTRWAVFCLTRQLRALLSHASVDLIDLGPARPEAVGEMISRWGCYYEHDPRVMAARVGRVRFERDSLQAPWSGM